MAYTIKPDGIEKNNFKHNRIIFKGEEYRTQALSRILSITAPTMHDRIRKHIDGQITYKEMTTRSYKKKRINKVKALGREWTIEEHMEHTGCSLAATLRRFTRLKASEITEEVCMLPAGRKNPDPVLEIPGGNIYTVQELMNITETTRSHVVRCIKRYRDNPTEKNLDLCFRHGKESHSDLLAAIPNDSRAHNLNKVAEPTEYDKKYKSVKIEGERQYS